MAVNKRGKNDTKQQNIIALQQCRNGFIPLNSNIKCHIWMG